MIRIKGISLTVSFLTMGLIFWNNEQIIHAKPKEINRNIDRRSYNLGVIGAFSEVVSLGIKKLALSAPLSPEEMGDLLSDAQQIAEKNDVKIYLEKDFFTTELFPEKITQDKYVLLIYMDPVLNQYMSLKKEKDILIKTGQYQGQVKRDIARKMGRLLSYPKDKIEKMLGQKK